MTHSFNLAYDIIFLFRQIITELHARGLIPQQAVDDVLVMVAPPYIKATELMSVLQKQMASSFNQEQYLIDVCIVLLNQGHRPLTDIATSILHQLGECVCVYIISDQYSHCISIH